MCVGVMVISPMEDPALRPRHGRLSEYVSDRRLVPLFEIFGDLNFMLFIQFAMSFVFCVLLLFLRETSNPETRRLKS